ncbi:uncharacterized protein LOC131079599 [Cryptomeria japonica]|uniref:uncharacterized protein LOC131079599 n=1 Tax=Cryptomeria japonica TaxID=3369 RepID=UPI0027DAA0AD|nr:uncharacterized protein LOC131079599 [Cryptomeria japonica]
MGKHCQALFGFWVWAVILSSLLTSSLGGFYPSKSFSGAAEVMSAEPYDPSNYNNRKPTYRRFNEVKEECKSVLKEASMLPPNSNRVYGIQNELSFVNGDWSQDKGSAPLMPYKSKGQSNYTFEEMHSPINLASFYITDVDSDKGFSAKMVNLSGFLRLAIATDRGAYYDGSNPQSFQIYPGFTALGITFEGVYLESKEEKVLCMLGSSNLPSRGENASDPWDWVENSDFLSPTLLEDDKILLQLHFPNNFSLTTREIRGKLKSLNRLSSSRYFNEIDIHSQLGAFTNYQFGSEGVVAKACNPYPYLDKLQTEGSQTYRGKQFCSVLMELISGQLLDVVPNWQCNGTDEYCSKLGSFMNDTEIQATNGSFKNTKLVVQDVRCVDPPNPGTGKSDFANVSAVFRAVPPSQSRILALERSGLNGLTLSAEGKWSSSSGQLCMVGCLGSKGSGASPCNSRICIYIPLSLSIKQRSVAVGSISSIQNVTSSFYPLIFELLLHPPQLPWDVLSNMTYTYSKTKLAGAMLEKDEPVGFGEQLKKSFLKYPWKENGKARESFSLLSEDLSVHSSGILQSSSKTNFFKTFIDLDVIAIDSFVGVDWVQASNVSSMTENTTRSSPSKGPEEEKFFLNVAAQLKMEGNFSKLFIEGLYDPRVGKMYLIGCRDVRAPWNVMHDSGDLEDGLDCLVNVKVEYPPTNARWFMNPTVTISVTSQRTEDDPFFFQPISAQTLPILYRRQREEIISRKSLEGLLRIVTLSMMIGCILSQLFYIRKKVEAVPYISHVMLGLQAIGYSIPLITGAEALFEKMKYDSENSDYSVLNEGRMSEIMDYLVKLLVLIALLLTLRLAQKVWKSRIRLFTRSPLEPWRVPSDKRVLAICASIHALGFLIVLVVHTVKVSQRPVQSSTYLDWKGNMHKQHEWETELKEYVGLMQDFFLLPQIVGNVLWQVDCKPLRKLYYIGVTVLRLLPHIYDYLRSPVFNPYFADEFEFANPSLDFYSKFGDIAIPVTAVVLAIVIYIQQRWNGVTLKRVLRSSSAKLMRLGSTMYERLPSQTFEAELVSGVNAQVNGHSHISEDESAN